jgi:Domain of unknown function (DUF4112)
LIARKNLDYSSPSMPKAITAYARRRYQEDALTPDLVDVRSADVEALARWLDYAFAVLGGFRFGVAGVIGLIPGIGDLFSLK